MRVVINKSEELKKQRKLEFSIYPENKRDIEALLKIQISIVLANTKNHGKIDDDKLEYPVTFNFNDFKGEF